MSYAVSSALQAAIFNALSSDVDLQASIGGAIYDALPPGTLPDLYVMIGPEQVKNADDKTGRGTDHRLNLTVVTQLSGFSDAKVIAGQICDVLHDASLVLTRGDLVFLRFENARAARIEGGAGRAIDLVFRARVSDSP